VTGREDWASASENHDAHLVIGFGPQERVVQLDEQAAILRVSALLPVEHDPRNTPIV